MLCLVALSWTVSAKNCLKSVHGFSLNQLTFGRNPNISNVFDNAVPALQGRTLRELVASNLNAMHTTRQHYAK